MEYVWLKYIWDSTCELRNEVSHIDEENNECFTERLIVDPKEVNVLKTTDGKDYESGYKMTDKEWNVFLCGKEDAKKYTEEREYRPEWDEENWSYRFWWAREITPTEEEKKKYYEIWKKYEIDKAEKQKDFENRKKAILHYLCKHEKNYLFGDLWRKFQITFDSVFDWILNHHHEYMPKNKVDSLDFSDVLRSFEKDAYILYYPTKTFHTMVILDKFFTLLEIKKAKKEYEQKKMEEKEKYSRMSRKSRWIDPFPSQENPQIVLNWAIITLWKETIDLNNKEEVEKHRSSYEKFEATEKEIDEVGKNWTLSGNFFVALRVLLSALDKSVWVLDIIWECKFKLTNIKKSYESYRELFKKYDVKTDYNHKKISKMKWSVNALLRRASVGEEWDLYIQIDSLPKKESPNKEDGWYVIKKMHKFSRDGKKTHIDGKKSRGYGKKK